MDKTTTRETTAVVSEAEFAAQLEKVNERNRQALAQLKPHELAQVETWLLTRTRDTPPVRPPSTPVIGRAPREARNDRPRGSRRSSTRRSSERSGDSGSEDGEPEPPQAGRLCACNCGESIDHRAAQAKYLNEQHAAAARQRRKRWLGRDWSEGVSPRDPYFQFDEPTFEQLRQRIEQGCRCNGHHIPDADDGHCIKCGHRRDGKLPYTQTVPARLFVSSHALKSRNPRQGTGRGSRLRRASTSRSSRRRRDGQRDPDPSPSSVRAARGARAPAVRVQPRDPVGAGRARPRARGARRRWRAPWCS